MDFMTAPMAIDAMSGLPFLRRDLLEKEHLKEAPEDRVLAQVVRKHLTLLGKFALDA